MTPGRGIVIIGAGPTGLGAATRLRERNEHGFRLLDAAPSAGGLAGSCVDPAGFTWDIGGHVQFSHYAYFDRVLDALPGMEWLEHQRESWVWVRNRFVPYPFQNNIHRLDPETRDRLLQTLRDAQTIRATLAAPANFREWILWSFGQGVADLFMLPYNMKVWAHPPEMLAREWVGERVAVPDLERVERNVRENRDDVGWGPNSTFRFPLRGGTGAIWRSLASTFDADSIHYGERVVAIDAASRTLTTQRGECIAYDTLVSTMPVSELVAMTGGLEGALHEQVRRLRYSSTHVIGLGMRGRPPESLTTKCWMYFPEANSPYYRVTVFSNYSPLNVPQEGPHWSLMAEVSESEFKAVRRETLAGEVIRACAEDGLIRSESEVEDVWLHSERHGYPIPTVGRDDILASVLPRLEEHGIFSRGRFGAWKYEVSNQDHSFMQGVEVVDRLFGEGDEPTLNRPDFANSGVFLKRD